MIKAGIDLGGNHIRLCTEKEGLIFDEPCMVALDVDNNVLAIGNEAKEMKGLTDNEVRIVSPLKKQSLNFDALEKLLEQLCYEFSLFKMFKKTVLMISYPTYFSDEQCDTLKKHLIMLGASRVYLDQELWIAAIGAQLDLFLPTTRCVMNLGSMNCDIAVFSSGSMQKKSECAYAGMHINVLIRNWLKNECGLLVSDNTCEIIKRKIGQVLLQENPKQIQIQAEDAKNKTMKRVLLNENQLVPILRPLVNTWIQWMESFLNSLQQEEKEDILLRGIVCCGGTMLLKGLTAAFQKELPCPIYVTDDPLHTVEQGLEILLSRMD